MRATDAPPARHDHAMAYDRNRDVLVVYGGTPYQGAGRLADTWEFDHARWRLVARAEARARPPTR